MKPYYLLIRCELTKKGKSTMNISVIGLGYVGLSTALLFASKHSVYGVDINNEKVKMINSKALVTNDTFLQQVLKTTSLHATNNILSVCDKTEIFILSLPTDYDSSKNSLDTSHIDNTIKKISLKKKSGIIIIKSTVPIGYTERVSKLYPQFVFFFIPEFLREGTAYYDTVKPMRIIIGRTLNCSINQVENIINLFKSLVDKKNTPMLIMSTSEAESVKLFSNAYLAMRISYFNELDTFAQENNLNSDNIIKGVCIDSRIGMYYNNPSFGYGGYCLPKDTMQLASCYKNLPHSLISAISESNRNRKKYIVDTILKNSAAIVGVYKIEMKKDSDNYRNAASLEIAQQLQKKGKKVIIYAPNIKSDSYHNIIIENSLKKFKNIVTIIIANRYSPELDDVREKVYTRDLFNSD